MSISGFDHVAIPIENVGAMLAFYRRLGFAVKEFVLNDLPFYSVHIGEHRINFHDPKVWRPEGVFTLRGPGAVPGCGDFCFVWDGELQALTAFLSELDIEIELGPVDRTGGKQLGEVTGQSFYIRDPDSNLLEFIVYP